MYLTIITVMPAPQEVYLYSENKSSDFERYFSINKQKDIQCQSKHSVSPYKKETM